MQNKNQATIISTSELPEEFQQYEQAGLLKHKSDVSPSV